MGRDTKILGNPDWPKLGTPDLAAGTEEQKAAAAQDFTAYAGRYEYLGEKLVIHVEVSLFPDWIGGDQEREAELKGNRLILSARTTRNGVPGRVRLVGSGWELRRGCWRHICVQAGTAGVSRIALAFCLI